MTQKPTIWKELLTPMVKAILTQSLIENHFCNLVTKDFKLAVINVKHYMYV